ncbi:MAG: nucleoside triphosphate pyrophosphohydrolase [Magnetospirillum sp.]|nr:nucleoside triphosphate pyrophosphohydrolase [Magnetospirillum sp.]
MPPIDRLLDLMAKLRDPDKGCAWDREQNFATIAPYTIEEAYEVADAIDQGDMAALRDELGDLLFQVVFHSRMAEEEGHFAFDDVARAITDKMIRRHPHVFGDAGHRDSATQTQAWEVSKAAERAAKGHDSVLDGVARSLPPMTRALKLQNRAARVGFDWAEAKDVIAKIDEEVAEIKSEIDTDGSFDRLEDEIGDLLFVCVNLARKLEVDPETALKRANAKFTRRFNHIERKLKERGQSPADVGLDEMEELWVDAKHHERRQGEA